MNIIDRSFLPSYTNSVHASCIEYFQGNFIFSWFGGSREGSSDVCTYIYNLNGSKKTIVIGQNDEKPRWNPILFSKDNRLLLFEKIGFFCDRWQTIVHEISQSDWRESRSFYLPAGLNGPVKTKPIYNNGLLYCGSSVETFLNWSSYIETYTFNKEQTLLFHKRSNPITNLDLAENMPSGGLIQPSICKYEDRMFALLRSSSGYGKVYMSLLVDEKEQLWSKPIETNLSNPNSSVDTIVHKDNLYVIHNPTTKFRYPLCLSKINLNKFFSSFDNDASSAYFDFENEIIISEDLNHENFISKKCNSPELSYPYMICRNDKIHITYTYGRKKIEYVVVDID